MKIAIIGTDYSYENKKITEEAKNRGHEATFFLYKDFLFEINGKDFTVSYHGDPTYILRFEAFLVRGTKGYRKYCFPFFSYLTRHNKKIISSNFTKGRVISDELEAYEKISKEAVRLLPTYYPISKDNLSEIVKKIDPPYVLKKFNMSQGEGIKKIDDEKELINFFEKEGCVGWAVQKFINYDHDIRVYVVGFKALGAMERVVDDINEFRANISLGGKAKAFDLSTKIKNAAEKAAKVTENEICGVDFLIKNKKYYLLEVNRNAQFKGFCKATNINVAKEIVEYIERIS